ncbi:MAG: peptide deformylase [Burkholderiales bacterium]|jgi:peptide deformylase|nr:peptide deformylase [Nitrosomonadaceae bacterium]
MAVRPILKMGTPSLMQPSVPLPREQFGSRALSKLLDDMKQTMVAAHGAGLAAPQIGENVRLVIFEVRENPRYPGVVVPFTVLINPVISVIGEAREAGWEGCLSVPGMRGEVTRPAKIRYTGFDEHGEPIDRTVEGFHARVVQHECDHLDGVLYPMRMTDMSRFGFTEILFPDLAPYDDD